MTKYDSTFREYILLNRDSVANMPSPPERDHRGQFFIDRSVGPPDQVAYVRLNAAGTAYEKVILYTATDLLPVASVDGSALTDGVATVTSGVFGSTLNLTINSIVNAGMFRTGSGGTPTITTGATDGPSAGSSATITSSAGGDYHSEFVLNANGTTSAGKVVTVAFSNALANSSYDVIFPLRNGNAADLRFYLNSRATSGFTIGARVAPTSGQPYNFSYVVIGR